jgi:ferric-dicitrate binding protein FerR (iron transport regulator)
MEKKEFMIADELLVGYLTGNATDIERMEVLHWLSLSNDNKKYFEQLRDTYFASGIINENRSDSEKSWNHVKARYYISKQQSNLTIRVNHVRKFSIGVILRYASIIILAFVLGGLFMNNFNKRSSSGEIVYNQVQVPLGSKTMIVLADGTKVWLNAGSKLRYPANFSNATRDVYLEGEAYFNVTKQLKRKFIVHTPYLNIKVLGTEFNVKAYPEEKTIQTTLVKGAITIENAENKSILKQPVSLAPNQFASFNKTVTDRLVASPQVKKKQNIENTVRSEIKEEPLVIVPKINPVIYTSWKEDRWIIEGEELASLAVKLERRYNVKISIKSESLKKYRFSGTLQDETLEQVLNIIKITAPIKYSIDKKNVVFEENQSFKKTYDNMLIR